MSATTGPGWGIDLTFPQAMDLTSTPPMTDFVIRQGGGYPEITTASWITALKFRVMTVQMQPQVIGTIAYTKSAPVFRTAFGELVYDSWSEISI